VLIAIFMWWEIRNDEPMLDLRFFENPRFSAASMSITLVFFAMFGSIFLLTQHLQFVLGYTPLQAVVRLMPVATLIVAAALSSRLVDRFGTKIVVVTGLVIVSFALFLLTTLSITSGYLPVALSIATLGMGMGITMAPATDSIMGSLPLGKAGVGSAMNDTTRQVGGALGVAIVGSIMSSSYSSHMAGAVKGLPAAAAAAARNSVGAATAVAAKAGPVGASLLRAAHVAYINAMGDAVMVAAGVALLGAIVSLLFLPARPAEAQAEVTERERELEVA
jgi:hypothetical protein